MTSHLLTLNTGAKIPALGLGCWMGKPGDRDGENIECYEMVMAALKMGYRHLDTAYGYGNEAAVGKAIRDSGIPRSEIFLTTKLTNSDHGRVAEGFQTSLKALGVEYIDLFLIHWPQASEPPQEGKSAWSGKNIPYGEHPTPVDTWKEMEKLDKKLCRAIGVSNFSPKILDELAAACSTVPAVNQVESHIYLPQASLTEYCKQKGIVLTAYSPLGQPRPGYPSPVLVDETAKKVAEKYGKPVGTILLSWLIQRGWTTVPKSANPDRLKANMDTVKLEQADFDALSAAHKGHLQRLCVGQEDVQEKGEIMGWSLKDMGWEKLD